MLLPNSPSILKIGLRFIVCMISAAFLSSCYVTSQAWHHGKVLSSRELISDVLQNPETNLAVREKLEFSRVVLAFASESGLKVEEAYSYYIHTDQPVVSYLVQAAEPFELKAKRWWFPVVGSVPYLGFYKESDRDDKAEELRGQGYDVYTTGVGAYSSLGWFEDPIFSSMLRRSDVSFAHLLFHELTHRTFWAPGSTKFNEGLAEYVADILTEQFFLKHARQDDLEKFRLYQQDQQRFKDWARQLQSALRSHYQAFKKQHSDIDRQDLPADFLAKKQAIFNEYIREKRPEFKEHDFIMKRPWNNATVIAVSLYESDHEYFNELRRCVELRRKPREGSVVGGFLQNLSEVFDEYDLDVQSEEDMAELLRVACLQVAGTV